MLLRVEIGPDDLKALQRHYLVGRAIGQGTIATINSAHTCDNEVRDQLHVKDADGDKQNMPDSV